MYTTWKVDGDRHSHSSWFIMAPKTHPPFVSENSPSILSRSRCIHIVHLHYYDVRIESAQTPLIPTSSPRFPIRFRVFSPSPR